MLTAYACDLMEVLGGEVVSTLRAHIQAFDTEIYGVGAGIDSCHEGLIRAHGRHNFIVFSIHW